MYLQFFLFLPHIHIRARCLYRIFQFSDIPFVFIIHQSLKSGIRNIDFTVQFFRLFAQHGVDQFSLLNHRPLAQSGNRNGNGDPAQQCFQQSILRILRCRKDKTTFGSKPVIIIAHFMKDPFIHKLKQLFLAFRFQAVNLVQKQNSSIRQRNQSVALIIGTGIGTFDMTEQIIR